MKEDATVIRVEDLKLGGLQLQYSLKEGSGSTGQTAHKQQHAPATGQWDKGIVCCSKMQRSRPASQVQTTWVQVRAGRSFCTQARGTCSAAPQ